MIVVMPVAMLARQNMIGRDSKGMISKVLLLALGRLQQGDNNCSVGMTAMPT